MDISTAFQYFVWVHMVVVLLLLARFFEHLKFQKRMSVVHDTFEGIFDDLLHIGITLLCVCFMLGVACTLAFGALDPEFQSFMVAFGDMIKALFGDFKPAAILAYEPP